MKKISKCPICSAKYINYESLINHIESKHSDVIADNCCESASHLLFNLKYNKKEVHCIICGKKTKWNEQVGRYERLCSDECRKKYRESFKKRMIDTYGKVHLLNDPNMQKKMLSNRKISGKYKWKDGTLTEYVGSYELKFLEFLDKFMNWNSKDILSPAPQIFYYNYENKKHFYIPDFYIESINLLVEIKEGGTNPNKMKKIQEVDKVKEKLKDEVMLAQKKFNYIKITDNDFKQFLDFLVDLKNNYDENKDGILVILNEEVISKEEFLKQLNNYNN